MANQSARHKLYIFLNGVDVSNDVKEPDIERFRNLSS